MAFKWAPAHVEPRRERPLVWLLIDLGAGAALTGLLWVGTNRTSALGFASFWAVLIVIGLPAAGRRRHHNHT